MALGSVYIDNDNDDDTAVAAVAAAAAATPVVSRPDQKSWPLA